MEDEPKKGRTIYETVEVAGGQLIDSVKKLMREGNVRKIRISDDEGDMIVEMPVTMGVIAGGVLTIAAPWLAVLGVIAALVTHVKIEVEREVEAEKPVEPAEPPTA